MSSAGVRRAAILTASLGCASLAVTGSAVAQDSPIYIRSIHLERQNVFSDSAAELNGTKRVANRIHVVTRERVLRREIPFTEGDVLDEELVSHAERELRGISFIDRANSRIEVTGDSADIYFSTTDAWTLMPGYIFESSGGQTELGLNLQEDNLLGLGKALYGEVLWVSDLDGPTWLFSFDDPQLLGSKYYVTGAADTGPLGHSWTLSTGKPFKSPDDPWSYGGGVYGSDIEDRLFNEGVEVSRVREQSSGFSVDATRAFGARYRKKKIGLEYEYYELLFSSLGDSITTTPLPDDELAHVIRLSGSIERTIYTETERINKFGRTEDIKNGRKTSGRVGRTLPIEGKVDRWELGASHRERFAIGSHNFLEGSATFSTLFDRDTILSFDGRCYNNAIPWLTFAGNAQFDYSWNLIETSQFLLGAENGLRGYPARQFNGDKRFVANLEARFFTQVEILTVAIGGVAFVDAGTAWQRNQEVDFGTLNYDVGTGLRLHYVKAAGSPVMRIDVGWPVGQAGDPQLTIGFGQYF